MYNVKNNLIGVSIVISLFSCGKKQIDDTQPRSLFDAAVEAYNYGDADKSMSLLDSLNNNYKDFPEILKESLEFRPKVIELQSKNQLQQLELDIAAMQDSLEYLSEKMQSVGVVDTGGYLTPKDGFDTNFLSSTAVSPRVDENGRLFFVSSVSPSGGLKHNSITFVVANQSMDFPVIDYDGELNYRHAAGEMITFAPGEFCDSVAVILASADPASFFEVKFNGESGKTLTRKMPLSPFITAAKYSQLINKLRSASINKERLLERISLAHQKSISEK